MEVRNQDRLDPPRIDAGRLHVRHHLSRDEYRLRIEGLHLPATTCVAQRELAVEVDDERRNRNWYKAGRQLRGRQSLLGLTDAGILEVGGIVGLFPDAIVQGCAYGCSHLIPIEARSRIWRLSAERRCAERHLSIEAESRCRDCRG